MDELFDGYNHLVYVFNGIASDLPARNLDTSEFVESLKALVFVAAVPEQLEKSMPSSGMGELMIIDEFNNHIRIRPNVFRGTPTGFLIDLVKADTPLPTTFATEEESDESLKGMAAVKKLRLLMREMFGSAGEQAEGK